MTQNIFEVIKIYFNLKVSTFAFFQFEHFPYTPYFSTDNVYMPATSLGSESKFSLRICNELPDPLDVCWDQIFLGIAYSSKSHEKYFKINDSFKVAPICQEIQSDSSVVFKIYFAPQLLEKIPQKFFEGSPPYVEHCEAKLYYIADVFDYKTIKISGNISYPKIQFDMSETNLNTFYVGQKQCITIPITNVDVIPSMIRVVEQVSVGDLSINCKEIFLNPAENYLVRINYFSKTLGPINEHITFKVAYGPKVDVFLRYVFFLTLSNLPIIPKISEETVVQWKS